ncbi:MAG: hypothetical protein EOP53_21540 [Sphingobacteriales bacterium]|nr:MAG: hypothetical protein EOP53_21540 [Sphingobacteriales bacterium]
MLPIAIALSACYKLPDLAKVDNSIPDVILNTVKMAPGGNMVELSGTIKSVGGGELQFKGFCYSNHPNTQMHDNMHVITDDTSELKLELMLMFDSTYYFRCFAQNQYGEKLSNEIRFTVPHPNPSAAPCELNDNEIFDQGNTYPIENVYASNHIEDYGKYNVHVSNFHNQFMPSIDIDFKKVPINGIYVTIGSSNNLRDIANPNAIYVRMFNDYPVEEGDSLFVAENIDGTLTMSFCNFNYKFNTIPINAKGKFNFKK